MDPVLGSDNEKLQISSEQKASLIKTTFTDRYDGDLTVAWTVSFMLLQETRISSDLPCWCLISISCLLLLKVWSLLPC